MIEKLEKKQGNYIACQEVLFYIKERLNSEKGSIVVGEVGVDIGATAVEIISCLNEKCEYYYFDFDVKVNELNKDFANINQNNVQLFGYGNTNKIYDSYGWNIAKLYKQWKENYRNIQRFDVVYIDGAHTYLHDSGATCILKEMVKKGGYLIFDDLNWSIAKSPTVNPTINKSILNKYTMEQIEACQVSYVTELFMDTDSRYEMMTNSSARVGIYKRVK